MQRTPNELPGPPIRRNLTCARHEYIDGDSIDTHRYIPTPPMLNLTKGPKEARDEMGCQAVRSTKNMP